MISEPLDQYTEICRDAIKSSSAKLSKTFENLLFGNTLIVHDDTNEDKLLSRKYIIEYLLIALIYKTFGSSQTISHSCFTGFTLEILKKRTGTS